MIVLQVLAVVLGSYLLGAIPFGLLVVCIANVKTCVKLKVGEREGRMLCGQPVFWRV